MSMNGGKITYTTGIQMNSSIVEQGLRPGSTIHGSIWIFDKESEPLKIKTGNYLHYEHMFIIFVVNYCS